MGEDQIVMNDKTYIPLLGRHLTRLKQVQIEAVRLVGKLANLNARGEDDIYLQREIDMILVELEELEQAEGLEHPRKNDRIH